MARVSFLADDSADPGLERHALDTEDATPDQVAERILGQTVEAFLLPA